MHPPVYLLSILAGWPILAGLACMIVGNMLERRYVKLRVIYSADLERRALCSLAARIGAAKRDRDYDREADLRMEYNDRRAALVAHLDAIEALEARAYRWT